MLVPRQWSQPSIRFVLLQLLPQSCPSVNNKICKCRPEPVSANQFPKHQGGLSRIPQFVLLLGMQSVYTKRDKTFMSKLRDPLHTAQPIIHSINAIQKSLRAPGSSLHCNPFAPAACSIRYLSMEFRKNGRAFTQVLEVPAYRWSSSMF